MATDKEKTTSYLDDSYSAEGLEVDIQSTLRSRSLIAKNKNLLSWYDGLYRKIFLEDPDTLRRSHILEIGSGISPLKTFLPKLITSDILPMSHIDLVFDAHKIDQVEKIADESLDVITMTNVLHHLESPIDFMQSASSKLRPGGRLIIVEPYFSFISTVLYVYLHHEPTDFNVQTPHIRLEANPLATANICLPYLIFFKKLQWLKPLDSIYDLNKLKISHYSSMAYALSGGISRRLPVPHFIYRTILKIEQAFVRLFPKFFAFEFIAELPKR